MNQSTASLTAYPIPIEKVKNGYDYIIRGGIFDIISDFVTDIIEDPPFEVPDESGIGCFVSMITDKMIQIFSNNLYDTLVEEKKKQ